MTLTKKQIQLWAFGAVGGAVVIVILVQFVVAPMIASLKDNRKNALALREQLDISRKVIGRGAELQHKTKVCREQIRILAANMPLPVLGNYLLGREQQVRACGAGLNMLINTVTEQDVLDVPGWNDRFKVYRVRVTAQAGINELSRFFQNMHAQNPLVSLAALNIAPQPGVPDRHNISFVLAWPIWANPDKRPEFLLESETKPAAQ